MGMLHVPVKVAHPAERDRAEEITLPVDTGGTFTALPPDLWRRIGLTVDFTRWLRTADGRVLERD